MNIAVVQARMGSTRLPGKVLKNINDKTIIDILISRLRTSKLIDKIIVATTTNSKDDNLEKHLQKENIEVFRGSEEDVLDRFYQLIQPYKSGLKAIIRITGDCPLVDPFLVDNMIEYYFANHVDYLSNVDPPTFPDGLDIEIFSYPSLELAWNKAKLTSEREHVTVYIRNNLTKLNYKNPIGDFSDRRWTLDYPEDLEVIRGIFNEFDNICFDYREVLELEKIKPELFNVNKKRIRNDGLEKSINEDKIILPRVETGQKLWKDALNVIPGGNGLLSKQANRYGPDIWPAYFSKANGVKIWDYDNNEYIDMAQMGIGTCVLGYSDPDVNNAVIQCVNDGVNTSLNTKAEVDLAKKMLELNTFAGGVKFARTGGEAMAIAVRIARAYTGKDTLAFSGYHGWSDWYIASNLSSDANLDGHLLPGLQPKGVPRGLAGTAIPFKYNSVEALEEVVNNHDIGVIVFEGARYDLPEKEFINAIMSVAKKKGIIVVVDEITSGWRMTNGGVYSLLDYEPDIVVYGKAMGNGFAISTIVGRKEIMSAAQDTFISSTFWTERVGFTAALATIDKFEKKNVSDHLIKIGTKIGKGWERLAEKHGVNLHVTDFKPLITFKLEYDELNTKITTLFIQEMLKRGYIAAGSVYVSYAHSEQIVDDYMEAVDEVFEIISKGIKNNNIDDFLETDVIATGFTRLT